MIWDSDVTLMMVTKIYNMLMLWSLRVSHDLRDCNSFKPKESLFHCILGTIHRDSSDYLNILQNSCAGSGTNISVMSSGPSWLHYLMRTVEEMCVFAHWARTSASTRDWWQHFLDTDLRTINARLAWCSLSE